MIAAQFGQPWSEALKMGSIERQAFIMAARTDQGWTVDWATGHMTPPKTT